MSLMSDGWGFELRYPMKMMAGIQPIVMMVWG
jgi:hypothetical protein